MEPLKTCKLFGAVRAILGIRGALPIVHGPVGCSYHTQYLLSLRSSKPIRVLTTQMEQQDVVFGAEDKLERTILHADKKYQPKLIAVLTSCASGIIGEDVDRVLKNVHKDVQSILIAINSGGFEGNQTDGQKECLLALMDLMEEKDHQGPSLNLVGQFRGGPDLANLKKYFKKLDININCVLTSGCTIEEIKNVPQASLNVSMCDASGVVPSQAMERKFDTPFLEPTLPMGLNSTVNFFQEICQAIGSEYTITPEEKRCRKMIESYQRFLHGKRVVIVAGSARGVSLTDFVTELGMDPVLISLDLLGPRSIEKMETVLKRHEICPVVLSGPDYQEIIDHTKDLEPDIILGGMGEMAISRKLEIPLLDVMHGQEFTLCFEGAVELASQIKKNILGP